MDRIIKSFSHRRQSSWVVVTQANVDKRQWVFLLIDARWSAQCLVPSVLSAAISQMLPIGAQRRPTLFSRSRSVPCGVSHQGRKSRVFVQRFQVRVFRHFFHDPTGKAVIDRVAQQAQGIVGLPFT